MRRAPTFAGPLLLAAVIGLPLLGAVLAGRPAAQFFLFPPPLRIPADYLRFSWWAASAVALCVVVTAWPWLRHRRTTAAAGEASPRVAHTTARHFPAWGVIAIAWTLAWWVLAWNRFAWFAPLQRYTFFPLWLGFIVALNAAVERRTGSCLMRRAPGRWFALFAASAACWWGFEWLNRFVENWHYLNVADIGAAEYAVHATFCFSTVLPAVAAIAEWIDSHGGWRARVLDGPACRWLGERAGGTTLLVAGAVSLLAAGVWPRVFYPALWVGPLALALGAAVLLGRAGVAGELARGDWSRAATWMIAALACGFFWELWNWHSAAKWIYTVPGVDRWHLFEMPALGYVGYLPFGLECLLVTEAVLGAATPASASAVSRAAPTPPAAAAAQLT